ncbi:hypothetical protein M427DRAFT_59905 [Gonapodya prolifera JEL478]|uniref:2',3'-cyclic-nucleotide 3'-phosphodiesterase n=1 Tax=Gonapodya prolifera (strain JEL478) TaxID=1344416 RepID=A0A139A5D8_GONPJ|nr:hypothetical protein M427DRAFT_59905 [Gonapodya prolifera JEL478]|eukprot:KXS12042.1 hypothetical protein M427DRAFT_59905 [Gonapodya prolifera JEL478]
MALHVSTRAVQPQHTPTSPITSPVRGQDPHTPHASRRQRSASDVVATEEFGIGTHKGTCSIHLVPSRDSPLFNTLSDIIKKYNKGPFVPHIALLQWIPYNDETKETVWWNIEKSVRELRRSTGRKSLKIQFDGVEFDRSDDASPLVYLRVHSSPSLLSLRRILRLLMEGATTEDWYEPRMAVMVGDRSDEHAQAGTAAEQEQGERTCEEVERTWPDVAREAFEVSEIEVWWTGGDDGLKGWTKLGSVDFEGRKSDAQ